MKITILTLFPEMFEGPFSHSILKKAQEKNLLTLSIKNIRDFGIGTHKIVDDTPYGGGVGMLLKVDVVKHAIDAVIDPALSHQEQKVILTSAKGNFFSQKKAREYSTLSHLIIICGHYEGIDHRILSYVDEEISVGPFVTTGGEIPAMCITDSIARLIPGVLKQEATIHESFTNDNELEYPQYTNPREFLGEKVPEVLLSGHHQKIDEWKKTHTKVVPQKPQK